MARPKTPPKKYFTVDEANAMLPLVGSIVRDITELAKDLRQRQERLASLQGEYVLDEAHKEEIQELLNEFSRDQERMQEFEQELGKLGVELKDYFLGLIDFPCRMTGREVYLCWRLGEPEISHWHELDAGFAGRQKLVHETTSI